MHLRGYSRSRSRCTSLTHPASARASRAPSAFAAGSRSSGSARAVYSASAGAANICCPRTSAASAPSLHVVARAHALVAPAGFVLLQAEWPHSILGVYARFDPLGPFRACRPHEWLCRQQHLLPLVSSVSLCLPRLLICTRRDIPSSLERKRLTLFIDPWKRSS